MRFYRKLFNLIERPIAGAKNDSRFEKFIDDNKQGKFYYTIPDSRFASRLHNFIALITKIYYKFNLINLPMINVH